MKYPELRERLNEISRERYKVDFDKLTNSVKRAWCMDKLLSEIKEGYYRWEQLHRA